MSYLVTTISNKKKEKHEKFQRKTQWQSEKLNNNRANKLFFITENVFQFHL